MLYKKDTIDMSFVQCHYEEQDGYISIDDEYTNTILSMAGYKECDFQTMCHRNINIGDMETYALRSPMNSYTYAQYVLKGRFELGEPMIATDGYCSYLYAKDVLEGRFELGENSIIKSAINSFMYAYIVLDGIFELGEEIISTNAEYSYAYAKDVLEGRFEIGEPAIATDQEFSYGYARFVLNDRFELGENIIKSSTYYKSVYEDYFNIKL